MNHYGVRLLRKPGVRRAAALIAAVTILAFRILTLVADQSALPWAHDFDAYWAAAHRLLDGQALYAPFQLAGPYPPQGDLLFLNPPILAVLVAPFAAVLGAGSGVAYAIWSIAGVGVFAASVFVLGRRGEAAGRLSSASPLAVTLALLALPAVSGELVNGNVDFFLAGLLTLAWLALDVRTSISGGNPFGGLFDVAGIAIGFATILKVFPGLLIVWLLLSGRWRTAGWAIGTAVVLAVVSLPFTGLQVWLDYPAVLLNMGGATDPTFALAPTAWLGELIGMTPARIIAVVVGLVVLLAVSVQSRPGAGRTAAGRAFAATIAVALLLSPVLWTHYLALAVVALLIGLETGVPGLVIAAIYVGLSVQNQPALGDLGFTLSRLLPMLALLGLAGALLVARRTAVQGTR